jgi:hypothetical protein
VALPDSVYEKAQFTPIEDILIAVLESYLPEVNSGALITMNQTFPYIQVRRLDSFGLWSGDERFLDDALVGVYTLAAGVDADRDAAVLADAVRVSFAHASATKLVLPGLGSIVNIQMTGSPRRVSDWATATGPVQYADLPSDVTRYETRYDVVVRRPR